MKPEQAACPDELALDALARNELRAAEARTVETHVESCTDCRGTLDELRLAETFSGILRAGRERLDPDERRRVIESATKTCSDNPPSDLLGARNLLGTHDRNDAARAGAAPDAAPPPIPNFTLLRRLGAGHFGEVWLARSDVTGGHRAIKVVRKARVLDVERGGLKAFEVLAERHPHLVEIQYVGDLPDALYYVMELADGYDTSATFSADDYEPRTLEAELARRGRLDLETAARIALAMLDALEYLHVAGPRQLLHRDVKPANVVFVNGVPKLIDVGLLTPIDLREIDAGTPRYMPPESVIDTSGDLYCLGKTLYEMVAGCTPTFEVVPADEEARRACSALVPVIDQACASDRRERFQRTSEFRAALLAVPELQHLREPDRVAGSSTRWTWISVAVVALAAVLFGPRLLREPVASQAADVEAIAASIGNELQLHYQKEGEAFVERIDALQRFVPIGTQGRLRAVAVLDEPAYALIAYRDDGDSKLIQVYPPKDTEPVMSTTHETGGFKLEPPASAMTFLLLTAQEPFEDAAALLAEIDSLGAPPSCSGTQLIAMGVEGVPRVLPANPPKTRGIDPDDAAPMESASARPGLLGALRDSVGERFAIRALVIPQQEDPEQAGD